MGLDVAAAAIRRACKGGSRNIAEVVPEILPEILVRAGDCMLVAGKDR